MLTISFDKGKLDTLQESIGTFVDGIEASYLYSLNSAAFDTRAMLLKELSTSINTDPEKINAKLHVKEANGSDVNAGVTISDRPISLKHFGARQAWYGVSYRPLRNGGDTFVPHAFGPKVNRLGRDVFVRTGKKRLPIERVPGVSVAKQAVELGLEEKAKEHFRATFIQRLKQYLVRSILLGNNGMDLTNG